jgi:hypothetical protein
MRRTNAEFFFLIWIVAGSLLIVTAYQFLQSNQEDAVAGSGYQDVVFAVDGGLSQVCVAQDADIPFTKAQCHLIDPEFETDTLDVALGDFDEDGRQDIFLANGYLEANRTRSDKNHNRICLNEGRGKFSCSNASLMQRITIAVTTGDFNNDNHLDVVLVSRVYDLADTQAHHVCLGDGAGAVSCQNIAIEEFAAFDVEAGDLNNDGNLDLVFVSIVGELPHRLCLGNGAGEFECRRFSEEKFPIEPSNRVEVKLADLNSDGHLDAAFAFSDDKSTACLNDGKAMFSCNTIGVNNEGNVDLALGDINQDGYIDVVFLNEDFNGSVCLSIGGISFVCETIEVELGRFSIIFFHETGIALADLNRDGHLDVIFGTNEKNKICFGNGTNTPFPKDSCIELDFENLNINKVIVGEVMQ